MDVFLRRSSLGDDVYCFESMQRLMLNRRIVGHLTQIMLLPPEEGITQSRLEE